MPVESTQPFWARRDTRQIADEAATTKATDDGRTVNVAGKLGRMNHSLSLVNRSLCFGAQPGFMFQTCAVDVIGAIVQHNEFASEQCAHAFAWLRCRAAFLSASFCFYAAFVAVLPAKRPECEKFSITCST